MWEERIAEARIDIEMCRLLCLKAAYMMDRAGNKAAQSEIAMIKVAAPHHGAQIIDDAIQAFGGAGVCDDFGWRELMPSIRTLRLADGPDEVHAGDRQAGVQEASMSEQALDEEALGAWLEANVEGFSGPFELTKFPSGQSNPTYRIRAQSDDYVLRRKPFGQLLPSAHAVDREYRLLSALHPLDYPVPRPLAYCDDPEVIGAIFYVMELARGRAYANGALPDFDPGTRAGCTSNSSMRSPIFTRSTLKPRSSAISASRAIISNARSCAGPGSIAISQTDYIPEMERLISFLPETLPQQSRTCVVHGDYRIDNVLFDGDGTLTAVLDWELATLGDPLADFSYLAVQWMLPADGGAGLGSLDLDALGIPALTQVAKRYSERLGVPVDQQLDWYFAYNLFRLARHRAGHQETRARGNREPCRTPRRWPSACRCWLRPRGISRSARGVSPRSCRAEGEYHDDRIRPRIPEGPYPQLALWPQRGSAPTSNRIRRMIRWCRAWARLHFLLLFGGRNGPETGELQP